MSGVRKSQEIIDKIIQEYKDGVPVKDISKKYNHSWSGISIFLRKNNVERNRKNVFPKLKFLIEDYNNGFTIRLLSKKYNVSSTRINKMLNDNNVERRYCRGKITNLFQLKKINKKVKNE